MRYLIILTLLATPALAGDDVDTRLRALEKRVAALDRRLKRIEDLLTARRAAEKEAADRATDLARVREIVIFLIVDKQLPIADGALDVYSVVKPLDVLRSARFGGPPDAAIRRGDYSKFPYARYRGDGKNVLGTARKIPLLWDTRPDKRGQRLVGLQTGAVRFMKEAEFQELLATRAPK